MLPMGPPIKTKAKGDLAKAYVLRKFLDLCNCSTDSHAVYQQLRDKGITSRCKMLASGRTGRGGRQSGTKKGGQWMASLSYLEKAYPHIMAGFI